MSAGDVERLREMTTGQRHPPGAYAVRRRALFEARAARRAQWGVRP